jgi:hypothetical protein
MTMIDVDSNSPGINADDNICTQYSPAGMWTAFREDYEPGLPIGHGRTEDEAINDLLIEENSR